MPETTTHHIQYADFHTGYRTTHIQEGSMCVRPCILDWDDYKHFVEDMLGWSVQNGANIERTLPDKHPVFDFMYATECELVQGIGAPSQETEASDLIRFVNRPGSTTSGKCIVNVTYKNLDFDVRTDEEAAASGIGELSRYVTRTRSYATEALQIPGSSFVWTAGPKSGNPVSQPWTRTGYTMELSYLWTQVPSIPEAKISNCIGCVNHAPFDNPTWGTEKLLFVSPDIRRTRTAAGDVAYDITYKFLFRKSGWNSFFIAEDPPGFYGVKHSNNVNYPYTPADLTQLFTLS